LSDQENPFDKVFLVARIAGLEVTNKHLTDTVAVKDRAIFDMAQQLKSQGLALARASQLKKERVLEAFSQVSSWLSPNDSASWVNLLSNPDFVHGLSSVATALILETLHGARPEQEG